MKIILNLTLIILFCYICTIILLYVFQRNFLYFPTKNHQHFFEKISISSHGETIEVIILNKGHTNSLIYFGGNGEDVIASADKFSSNFSDITIYLVCYRGYGGSSGKPTEAGIYADALTIYDQVKELHNNTYVAGRSLGSGVATYLAANRPIERTVLITPYDSVLNIAKDKFAIFPIKLLLKDQYDSFSRVKNIKSKILVLAAEFDQIIPMSHTQRLINEFENGQVIMKIISQMGHNNLSNSAEYYKIISDFMN